MASIPGDPDHVASAVTRERKIDAAIFRGCDPQQSQVWGGKRGAETYH